ncbi:MAG: DUF2207 domain-containing protein [Ignavibacteriales bacterium]|nr:DUF2207 domain-containing protein [Ignavibacteriales bacterium]
MQRLTFLLFLLIIFCVLATAQSERILSFDCRIVVNEDASLTITEAIKILSTGVEFQHGIYRDFPTEYKDRYGNDVSVGFDVLSVLRDNTVEPYTLERQQNGKRIRIGDKDVFLNPGQHIYIIAYTTTKQIGFFESSDELYWNATGNGWRFSIDKATATVKLPRDAGTKITAVGGFTGLQGSRDKNYSKMRSPSGTIVFSTTRPLLPGEGLTILLAFPKGYVQQPTWNTLFADFFSSNISVAVACLGILLLFIYYMIVWSEFGIDPEKGTVIPLFDPPDALSPAGMRYIMNMSYDNKAFAATILALAVKGYLTIVEAGQNFILRHKKNSTAVLTPVEKLISSALFLDDEPVYMDGTDYEKVSHAIKNLRHSLERDFAIRYFVINRQYFIPGIVFSVILFAVVVFIGDHSLRSLSISGLLSLWTIILAMLLTRVISQWKIVVATGIRGSSLFVKVSFLTLLALPLIAGEVFGVYLFGWSASPAIGIVAGILVFINYLFYRLLKAPTRLGRKVMDSIEGFKMYLSTAEKDRLNALNPPERTPELFERFLPYALALDVEQAWSERFADVLSQSKEPGCTAYAPDWYIGSQWNNYGAGTFASSFSGSFNSAISSSATAPGSNSGFSISSGGSSDVSAGGFSGGGGSSGGGGGGGGGGGW